MNNEIKDILQLPALPDGVKQAINNKELAIFIGAGVSRFAGCDSWDTLAKNLVEKCRKEGIINHFEQVALLKNNDKIKLITICDNILKDRSDLFMDEMAKSLKNNNVGKYSNDSDELKIYRDLKNLGNTFITTNADRYFDSFFDKTKCKSIDFTANNISNNELYKIHGCISNKTSLVFTMDRYIKTYNTDTQFAGFIKEFFRKYTILFVGYGLKEFELLNHIFYMTSENKYRGNFYYLKPYFKHEKNISDFDNEYFDNLGIKLIPFAKDEKGYDQLKDVIDNWHQKACIETRKLQNSFDDIDKSLENPS